MALSKLSGGSGYSGTLSANATIRQQQLICDPAEPQQGSTSVQYEADKVTLRGMTYGPGYGPAGNFTALVEVEANDKRQLQTLPSFLDRPLGKETGFVQVFYQLKGEAGQITPPRTFQIVDEEGVDGVDTHALDFELLPNTPDDALVRYAIYADPGNHSGNPPDYMITPEGKRLGPADISPALASTKPDVGSVSGTVFEDVNGDADYNAGDKPIGGVTVYLDLDGDGVPDDNEPKQTSDVELGTYLFTGVKPGKYQVREVRPAGYLAQLTVPTQGFYEIEVAAGRRTRLVDFGHLLPGTASGIVFNDANGDGLRQRVEGGLADALVYVDLNRNGQLDLHEPSDRSSALGGWSIGGLAPGTYVIRQIAPAGFEQTTPTSFNVATLEGSGDVVTGVTFGDRPMGPRVTGVFISGTTWAADFKKYLGSSGLGDGLAGFAVNPRDQFRAQPWAAINQVSIRFDSPVDVEMKDLTLKGYTGATIGMSRLAYDAPSRTATWTLSTSLVSDRLTLNLNADAGGVTGTNGQALDGEWVAGNDTFPSGDGKAGGDFVFGFNVLAGDATGDGLVNALDLSYARQRLNRSVASPGSGNGAYSVFADVNPDTRINALDLSLIKQRLNGRLPRIILPPPILIDPPIILQTASVTKDVFSATPLV